MIQQFEVKDFKGHEGDRYFPMPGLTVVTGTNNSGKSSLLQAIYLLTQNRTNRFSLLALNEQLRLGNFSDILHKEKRSDDTLELAVEFDAEFLKQDQFQQLSIQLVYKQQSALDFQSTSLYSQDHPVLVEMYIDYQKDNEEEKQMHFAIVEMQGEIYYEMNSDSDSGFFKLHGIVPEPISYQDVENGERCICSEDLDVIRKYLSFLNSDNIKYLKAFRLGDFRESTQSVNQELGLSGEYTAETIAVSWDREVDFYEGGQRLRFSQFFDRWTRQFLGEDYRVRSEFVDRGEYKIVVEEPSRGMKFTLDQVGFGISQMLPVLTLVATSKRGDVILIENPEVHLHPKLQAHFVDLCIFAMENGRKLVIETHSEHIINRIRLRIKQSPELLERINIFFFEKIEGDIRSTEIEVTPEGKLAYWPKNFFDQSYYDLLGLIE